MKGEREFIPIQAYKLFLDVVPGPSADVTSCIAYTFLFNENENARKAAWAVHASKIRVI